MTISRPDLIQAWNPECPICWGTGTTYPTFYGALSCPNGCRPIGRPGEVWAGDSHPQMLCTDYVHVAWVDVGVEPLIQRLWAAGVLTWVSCQGDPLDQRHRNPPYVAILDQELTTVAERIVAEFGTITESSSTATGTSDDHYISWEWTNPPPSQQFPVVCACDQCEPAMASA